VEKEERTGLRLSLRLRGIEGLRMKGEEDRGKRLEGGKGKEVEVRGWRMEEEDEMSNAKCQSSNVK
jgi:hypothetical protein